MNELQRYVYHRGVEWLADVSTQSLFTTHRAVRRVGSRPYRKTLMKRKHRR